MNEIKEGKISFAFEEMEEFPLEVVKILWDDRITHLDLTGNKISNFEFLGGFIHLKSLILDGNDSLGSEKGLSTLPSMPNLELCYCNNCKITYPADFIFQLSSLLTGIKYLSIMDKMTDVDENEQKSHRLRMFAILMNPLLIHFNDKTIEDDEREHAERFHQYLGTIDCTFSSYNLISRKIFHNVVGMPCEAERTETSEEIEKFIKRKSFENKLENDQYVFKSVLKRFFLFKK